MNDASPTPSFGNPSRHFVVVLNEESGTVVRLGKEQIIETLTRVMEEAGIRMTLRAVAGKDIQSCLAAAIQSDADAIIVGGGDGTVACAATLLAGKGKTLGIFPLGTFNLAARDLGMPLDLEEAALALTTAPVTQMDAMELNGRLYLCMVVMGFYPALMLATPEYHGWWIVKALRTLRDSLRHMATFPALQLSLIENGKATQSRTRVALIVNNDYQDVFGLIPQRASLDAGYFTVYLSKHRTRFGMFRSMLAWVFGRWKQDREVIRLQATELEIHARHKRFLPIMMDGEIERLPLPLRIVLRPRVLDVLAPRILREQEIKAPLESS